MKLSAALFIIFFALAACNEEPAAPEAPKSKTSKTNKSPSDSYTADTMYQQLPQLLQNLSAITDIENLLAQNWTNTDDLSVLRDGDDGSLEFPVRTFSLSADKTVIKNIRNFLETGTWQFDNASKTIVFTYTNGSKDVYKLRALAADELRLTNIGVGSSTILVFTSDARRHKLCSTDPFHITNNQWRMAPAAPETPAAIKQRVKNYLHFFILYYKDVIARRAAVVSFYGFPSCIKWYAGGIYLQEDTDILENWHALFYNKAQGQMGLQIVAKLLQKKYTWPAGNENWIKKNLFVLEEMYKNL